MSLNEDQIKSVSSIIFHFQEYEEAFRKQNANGLEEVVKSYSAILELIKSEQSFLLNLLSEKYMEEI